MTSTAKALYSFFSDFGIPAYIEDNVPDEAQLPYITYQAIEPDWDDSATMYARVWYRSTGYAEIYAKVDEIRAATRGGVTIPTGSGCVMLNQGLPFAQNMPMEGDDTLKVVYLLFILNAFTL